MNLYRHWFFSSTMIILIGCVWSYHLIADGKFLRDEKWKRFSVGEAKADFYVAPDGNDSWSGTLPSPNKLKNDGPFATIERAQAAVRLLKQQVYTEKKKPVDKRYIGSPHQFGDGKDILVLIRSGYYVLDNPLVFSAADGGERCETELPTGAFEFHKLKDFYVTYAAFQNEKPIISGGRKITHWKKQKGKWVASVEDIEIKKLIVNNKEQPLARTPNEGYFTPLEMPESTTEFKFRPGDLKDWGGLEDNRIHFVLRWHTGINSISRIDEQKNVAYLVEPQKGLVEVPPRYYVENIEALLDAPGEWYFNRQNGRLSYIPEKGLSNPNATDMIAPILSQLMTIKGEADKPVRSLRFYGLTFEATNSGGNAITFEYAKNCELVDSELRNVGGIGVYLTKGCYQNRILNNKITNAEGGGIALSGNPHPEKWMDVVRENIVSYNYVSDCGGVSVGAHNTLFTTISHNEITHTTGRYAMNVGGWSNVEEANEGGYRIEYNHLHHVQNGADDSGAITCSGLTYDSIIRGNLIHDVYPGFFNDNVAFWFDNMSSGWIVEDNIYYNLRQGEMKLCACYLSDNTYRNNFFIESPENEPEGIIDGVPVFDYSNLEIECGDHKNPTTGERVKVSATVKNSGATGIKNVDFYVDGKVTASTKFPVIHNNSRQISFDVRFHDPGEHKVAIGSIDYKTVHITGNPLTFLLSELTASDYIVPVGQKIAARVEVENVTSKNNQADLYLYLNDKVVEVKSITLLPKETKAVDFTLGLEKGFHQLKINNTLPITIEVYPHRAIDLTQSVLHQYCSGTARPCEFEIDQAKNRYQIIVHGTDFFHAEDSYGAIYLKDAVKGNFIATVKVAGFGENVTEWFRTGIFVRNDLAQSYETAAGSLGSVLMFSSPLRFGMQWDEFGDGCMHKASSQNHEKKMSEIWLKLERHGDYFTGSISYDGENWIQQRTTTRVPGLTDAMDIGLAAGANNQAPSLVVFEDFRLEIEAEGWKQGLD